MKAKPAKPTKTATTKGAREKLRKDRLAVSLACDQRDWPKAGQTWYTHDGKPVNVVATSIQADTGEWLVTYSGPGVGPTPAKAPNRTVTLRRWFGSSGYGVGAPRLFSKKPPKK